MFPVTPRFLLLVLVALIGILAALSSLWAKLAGAEITATLTGSQITISYNEPTTSANGQPLHDLKDTRVYIQVGDGGPVLANTVPASRLEGGGAISTVVVVPVGTTDEADVTLWATASDLVGNESMRSQEKTVRVDRLPPAAPH